MKWSLLRRRRTDWSQIFEEPWLTNLDPEMFKFVTKVSLYLPMVMIVMNVMASVKASGASSFMIQSATRPVYWGMAISPEVGRSRYHGTRKHEESAETEAIKVYYWSYHLYFYIPISCTVYCFQCIIIKKLHGNPWIPTDITIKWCLP